MDATARPLPAPTGPRLRISRSLAGPPAGHVAGHVASIRPWGVQLVRHLAAREHRRLTLPLAAISVVSTLATAASPWLARWPLVLAMLSPRVPFLALAAVGTPLPVFLVLGTARLCIADPFHYLLGRRLADAGLARVRAPGRLARRIERCGTPGSFLAIVLRPIGRHLFAAGMTRARPVPVALADIASTIAFLVALSAGAGLV